ncbi:MAG: UDP-glucose dehydrogenase family protein [Bacteroidota bacterium]
MKITIIGSGYVGLNTGVVLAYLKHKVICVDQDSKKIETLKNGRSSIHEHGLETLLRETEENIEFTTDLAQSVSGADVIIIAVGTPAMPNGAADIGYVEAAVNQVASVLEQGCEYTIVIKSTVPVGTNRRIAADVNQILAVRGIKARLNFASNPEFLREGMALSDTFYPDRIVVGSDSGVAKETLRRMYLPILKQTFLPPPELPRPEGYKTPALLETSPASAEMIKYASNAFLALKISYINEIAGLCEKTGADVREVAYGIGLDSRIGPRFLNAGIGWGGSCFPKDTSALLALGFKYNYSMPIVDATCAVNKRQRQVIIDKLESELSTLSGRTVGILGLAFKPGTDDLRDSPAQDIINLLIERRVRIKAHDPVAIPNAQKYWGDYQVEYGVNPYQTACGCDALVLVTEWEEYLKLDFLKLRSVMNTPILIDGRNFLNSEELIKAGFIYKGVGIGDACSGNGRSGIHWKSPCGQAS